MLPSKHSTKTKYTLADLDRSVNLAPENSISKTHDKNTITKNQVDQSPGRYTSTNLQSNDNEKITGDIRTADIGTGPTASDVDENYDDDFEMIDVDNEQIESISNYLASQRSSISTDTHFVTPTVTQIIVPEDKTIFVADTNFVISHLNTLEELRQLSAQYNHVIVAPLTTIRELDGLKTTDDRNIAKLARFGNDWLFRNLGVRDSGIVGQRLKERLDPNAIKDDAILDCCLYFQHKLKHKLVILLSNDKNLCLKALTEGLLTVSFRPGMSANLIAETAYNENISRFGGQSIVQHTQLNISEVVNSVYGEMQTILLTIIDHIMNQAYGDDIIATNYEKDKVKSFADAGKTIAQFWLAVFADYFQRYPVRHNDWKNLPDTVLEVPHNVNDLKTFFEFWEKVLKKLIVNLDQNDKTVVLSNIEKWNRYIAFSE
ncbi:hypothetical protein RNJ44_05121 [Nakaseomyces bracarensis]|uniref:PIN domain-containing protein n=1 Tax=Nakaseomyces bracarensis TaxID=273131 RepID=A0ABR4NWV1_9SACH